MRTSTGLLVNYSRGSVIGSNTSLLSKIIFIFLSVTETKTFRGKVYIHVKHSDQNVHL